MTPAARLAGAAVVLDSLPDHDGRADVALKQWGRRNRYAGSKDRAAVADIVYACLRRRRSLAWLAEGFAEHRAEDRAEDRADGCADGRALTLALTWEDQGPDAVAALFTGARYAPTPPTDTERAALSRPPDQRPPPAPAVALDWPDWLWPEATRSLGDATPAALNALRTRAPADLRVNALKATVNEARAALVTEGIATEPTPLSPWGLRIAPGVAATRSAAFAAGLIEAQDCASQAAALFSAAAPGETVLDYCAGGGGKTLALAAMVGAQGRVVAHDVAPQRMTDLPARAARAGAATIVSTIDTARLAASRPLFDLVFVDAPCSGSGAWRRNPDEKWRLTPARLTALQAAQAQALDAAWAYVRPGGRMVYATCSLLRCENSDQTEAFCNRTPTAAAGPCQFWDTTQGGDGFWTAIFYTKP